MGPGDLPPWRAPDPRVPGPSGVLERSTGRSLGLGVGWGRSDLHRLRPHTWPLPRDHFHRPVPGSCPAQGLCPPRSPDLKHKGRLSQRNLRGGAAASPTSWPQGAQRTLKTRGRRRRSLGGRRVGAGMGARGEGASRGSAGSRPGGRGESARGLLRPGGRGAGAARSRPRGLRGARSWKQEAAAPEAPPARAPCPRPV